jgi:DNA-binding SARP family transcriptional activator/TolB-like protein/Flp pilus assembly protein TadD
LKTLRSGLPRPDAVLLRLRLIGRMEALTLGNESVLPLGRKTRGLLAILALSGRRPVLRLRLAELLWSRRSEEQARASLRQEIHRLLEALSPLGTDVIAVERHTLALKPALTSVDAERILTANPGQAESLPPFEGVLLEELNGTDPALDQWLAGERVRLRDHAIGLFEEMLRRQRDPRGSLEAARQLLVLDGLHERAWQATIQGHVALGNGVLARQSGERCVAAFAASAGAAAGQDLRDALAAIGLLPAAAAPHEIADRMAGAGPDGPHDAVRANGVGIDPAAADGTGAATGSAASDHGAQGAWIADQPPPPRVAELPETRIGAAITGLPLLAVLPVQDLDHGAASAGPGFPTGLAASIQSDLSGSRWVRLLVGSELQDSLSQGRDDAVLRRSFGIDYVLDGTLQRIGGQLRAILRLSDIRQHGQLIWAQRFDDGELDLRAFQDLIASRVAARVPAELMLAESRCLRRLAESELDPQGLAVQALCLLNDGDRPQVDRAIDLLARSLARDGDNALAQTGLAIAHLLRALQRWDDPLAAAARAEAAARAAIDGNRAGGLGLVACAHILSELQDRPEAALSLLEQAQSLRPHSAEAWAIRAYPLIRLGRLDEAARSFATYKSLFATHPFQLLLDLPALMIPLLQGDDETAARVGLMQSELRPNYAPTLAPYLSALGHLRQSGEAERVRSRLLGFWPDCTTSALVAAAGLRVEAHAARFADGLRLAGLRDDLAASVPVRPKQRASRPLGAEPLAG